MQETGVQFLDQEGPLEEETATHSSILAWRIMDRGAWQATVHGITRAGHELALSFFIFIAPFLMYDPSEVSIQCPLN